MTENNLLNEASLSRIWHHKENRFIGIATAFIGSKILQKYNKKVEDFPNAVEMSHFILSKNRDRNALLSRQIRESGYGYYRLQGRYTETYNGEQIPQFEEVYFIIGPTHDDKGEFKKFMMSVGVQNEQECVLYKPFDEKEAYLISTRGNTWIGENIGATIKIGPWRPNVFHQFMTKLKGLNTFAFMDDSLYNQSVRGLWARKLTKDYTDTVKKGDKWEDPGEEQVKKYNMENFIGTLEDNGFDPGGYLVLESCDDTYAGENFMSKWSSYLKKSRRNKDVVIKIVDNISKKK